MYSEISAPFSGTWSGKHQYRKRKKHRSRAAPPDRAQVGRRTDLRAVEQLSLGALGDDFLVVC
jgi:hypothetical protein